MNIDFCINDYLLAWALLFKPAISKENQQLKEKLWGIYKKQYNQLGKDLHTILVEDKDFIPDNDLLYNIVFNSAVFKKTKIETEKYRFHLLKTFDEHKKEIKKIFEKNIKIKLKNEYQILLIHPRFNSIDLKIENKEHRNICWGFEKDFDNELSFIIKLYYTIMKYELDNNEEDLDIVNAIIELAILNELPTILKNKTYYLQGDKTLALLKRQIYPFFLMYMGADIEDYITYMMRDKIAFDIDKYPVVKDLRKMDIISFIKFCIKNRKDIVNIGNIEII
ncbi:MAG: hypothetical protein RR161_01390 [Bacilli bacterium]